MTPPALQPSPWQRLIRKLKCYSSIQTLHERFIRWVQMHIHAGAGICTGPTDRYSLCMTVTACEMWWVKPLTAALDTSPPRLVLRRNNSPWKLFQKIPFRMYKKKPIVWSLLKIQTFFYEMEFLMNDTDVVKLGFCIIIVSWANQTKWSTLGIMPRLTEAALVSLLECWRHNSKYAEHKYNSANPSLNTRMISMWNPWAEFW